jgi:hypothetical protein
MPMGTVKFYPDTSKGNTNTKVGTGMIKRDGTYILMTEGREGAPAGWYKVAVEAHGMPDPSLMQAGSKAPPPPPAVNARFTKPDSSKLTVEVKDGAPSGAYDFAVTK